MPHTDVPMSREARRAGATEDNRIQSLFDNGHEKTYKYDALQGWSNAAGDRTSGAADQGKRGPQGETVYVNQFFTSRPGANGTKHIYAGSTRIASKLMRQDVPNSNPNGKTPFEKDLYFYHPDHLGTSNYITDLNAKLYEHLEYFPFGEAWVEENSNTQRTPYLFTAKELDEETGLYYFGARYYDPRTSVWQSGDPALEKYLPKSEDMHQAQREGRRYLPELTLPGQGGVYRSLNLGLYTYTQQNPVRLVDPDGSFPLKRKQKVDVTASKNFIKLIKDTLAAGKGETTLDLGSVFSVLGIPEDVAKNIAENRGSLQVTIISETEATFKNVGGKLRQETPGKLKAIILGGKFEGKIKVVTDQEVDITNITGLEADVGTFFDPDVVGINVTPGLVIFD